LLIENIDWESEEIKEVAKITYWAKILEMNKIYSYIEDNLERQL
jgi:hypothetical protein